MATRNTHRAHKVRGRRPVRASSVAVSREDGPSKIAAARAYPCVRYCDRTVEHSPRNVGFVLGESGSETKELETRQDKTQVRPKTAACGCAARAMAQHCPRSKPKTRRDIRIERLLLFERRAAPARPWAPDGLELDRPTCVTLCYTGLEPATRAYVSGVRLYARVCCDGRKIIELNLPTCSCVVTNRGTTRVCPCRNTMSRLSSTTLLVVRAKYNWSAHTHTSHSEQRLQRTL